MAGTNATWLMMLTITAPAIAVVFSRSGTRTVAGHEHIHTGRPATNLLEVAVIDDVVISLTLSLFLIRGLAWMMFGSLAAVSLPALVAYLPCRIAAAGFSGINHSIDSTE